MNCIAEAPPSGKGYVKPQLKTHIPGLGDDVNSGMHHMASPAYSGSHPGTPGGPSYPYPQSPNISDIDNSMPYDMNTNQQNISR
jgi:hypothetical protein